MGGYIDALDIRKKMFFLFNFRRFYELIMVSLQCVKREFLKDKFIC